jgi:AraC-like DNA-binding protein
MNTTLRHYLGENDSGYIGKTDADYFTTVMTFRYREEDREVIETQRPLQNQPWIVENRQKQRNWYLSSKFPLYGKDNRVAGIAGIMLDYMKSNETFKPFFEMQEVLKYIFDNFASKISIEHLASMIFLSVSQFERRFYQNFRLTPRSFILKVRLDSAMRLLTESDLSITQIAMKTGFYDSSSFTRLFKKMTGIKPLEFRKKYTPKSLLGILRSNSKK